MEHPVIIQGGMGVGVSHWPLARAVSLRGQLGVVSGTVLDVLLARRLQNGDPGGHLRRALAALPIPGMASRILDAHFVPGGRPSGTPFHPVPMGSVRPGRDLVELTLAANFVEVFLAKEGHPGRVGINLLHKVRLPTLPSLYGAMLAGVDYVLVGAGIPMDIPGVIDRLARGEPARLDPEIGGDPGAREDEECMFDPAWYPAPGGSGLGRPRFLAIVSSSVLATALARRASGRVDGFVVEHASAGGHNAPPRGALTLNDRGEPVFGPRDIPDPARIRALGLPFWLAGSTASPSALEAARAVGATGVQVGTAFAFCDESGIDPGLKARVLAASREGTLDVFTDPLASPTGFPFKVARLGGTLSEEDVFARRGRVCDLGYLRTAYRRPDGSIGFRCPGEPEEAYVRKGGDPADTVGRKCLCNGLLATVGLGQVRDDGFEEPPIVTAGLDALELRRFRVPGRAGYAAGDVIDHLLGLDRPAGPGVSAGPVPAGATPVPCDASLT